MALRATTFVLLGLMLGGCMQATLEPASEASFTPRDKQLLANAPYAQATIPEPYRRHIVDYHRQEAPGSIVVDTDARYLYYVLPQGKAIRYGVTVGEDAQVWSGIAKVGNMQEWPQWIPTAGEKQRLGPLPDRVEGGPHNPMGARGIYLYVNGKDTLFRIHGTNQPEYIGQAISSGLHPHDQRGHHRSLQAGQDGHGRGCAGAAQWRFTVQSAGRRWPRRPTLGLTGEVGLGECGVELGGSAPLPFWGSSFRRRAAARAWPNRASCRARGRSRSNSSSISASVMMSGGQSETTSPNRNRTISPSSSANRTARGATPDFGSKARLLALSATSSSPPTSPIPRASPTSG